MLLRALFSGDILTIAVTVVAAVFLVFVCIPVHELAHGYVAYKRGDKSIKTSGQLSLDPLAHIDPLGAVMIALIGFGWGKPCRVNPYAFKNPKKEMAIIAASGPLSNLLLGLVLIFIRVLLNVVAPNFMGIVVGQAVDIFLQVTAQITIWLGVLNLLPIPMFDGFTIVRAFLKPQTEEMVMQNQQMIMIIVIILFFTRILAIPVEFISIFILKFFYWLCALPF